MAAIVYALCALTSLGCAFMLIRSYQRRPNRFIFWSTLCFIGYAINNCLLFIDLVVVPGPTYDLSIHRGLSALVASCVFIYGLIEDVA